MSRVGKYLVQLIKVKSEQAFPSFSGCADSKCHSGSTANSMLRSQLLSVANCSSQAHRNQAVVISIPFSYLSTVLLSPRESSYHVSIPWPGPSILHKFSLVLSFLWTTISKFAKQRIRRGYQERKQTGSWVSPHSAHSHSCKTPPESSLEVTTYGPLSLIPRCLTWYSRGCLNIFSIKVGDDGFTLLCGLHPKEHKSR